MYQDGVLFLFFSVRTERNALYAICCSWILILTSCIPLYLCHGIKKQNFDGKVYIHCGFLDEDYNHMAFHVSSVCLLGWDVRISHLP
ncbi:Allatostatin-A receptor [Portunus trituberculatus]|uniref:Allatostatin-A receptor n=1 Tax=Portunus trituberculatus TaxID=210409 RepID=A0A5B7IZY2_PORTR|nr:Allatostatin-A receptor [Portunus trituberculatus]